MIPRTSRTGTLRAASAVCAAAPSLLGLPLLIGAFLAVLWLLCAAPAQADTTASEASGPATALGAPVSEAAAGAGEALGLGESRTLDGVVPEEVAEPVASTLGTVHQGLEQGHQRLEKGAADTAAVAAALPEPAVTEVRGEVRGFVADLDRAREEAVERGPAHTLPGAEPGTPRSPAAEAAADTGADRRSERDREADASEPAPDRGAPARHAVTGQHHPAPSLQAAATDAAERGTADHAPEQQRVQPTTGSHAPTSNGPASAPSVAGYLTAAPLPAPATDAVRLAAHRLRAVPVGPAADPTVSPD
ncbi:hypothetical protein [Nocardiopsis ganjiahuensis]|uniref:hypothetical protein n=1 Tax=Nocardiopsis ganjiahuensis TaxID=239984 RepID=UPI00034BA7A3|nr:hypothetical protein [Nocardiopsis ganjiahuensis]